MMFAEYGELSKIEEVIKVEKIKEYERKAKEQIWKMEK